MKIKLLFASFFMPLALVVAQVNVQKTSGTNAITGDLTFASGKTLTLNGTLSGTPAGGTLNLSGVTLTLGAITGTSLTGPTSTDLTLSGGSSGVGLTLGQGASGVISSTRNWNGEHTLTLTQSSSGGSASADVYVVNNTGIKAGIVSFSSGFGVPNLVNTAGLTSTGKVIIAADMGVLSGGTNPIDFWVTGYGGGPSMRYTSTGNLLVGTTSESGLSGSGNLKVNAAGVFGGNLTVSGTGTSSVSGPWKLAAYVVSGLPAASSNTGALCYVTDANATTRLSTVAGGGSNKVIVYSDGTNWLIL